MISNGEVVGDETHGGCHLRQANFARYISIVDKHSILVEPEIQRSHDIGKRGRIV